MSKAMLLHRADGAALTTEFRRTPFGADDPFAAEREMAWLGAGGMGAGRVRFSGDREVVSYPHIETISIVEGQLTLIVPGEQPLTLEPRQAVVVGRGTHVLFKASAGVTFVYCAVPGASSSLPGLTALKAEADFKPSAPPPAETVLGPMPDCRSDNVFTDDATRYRAGTWDSTPYRRIIRAHRVNELMHLLEGSGRFEAPDGSALTAGAGDVLFVPKGAEMGWESPNRVAKFYVVQEVND